MLKSKWVTTRFFPLDVVSDEQTNIEILEPTSSDTPVGKFLEKRGPGIQQLCLAVDDLEAMIAHLMEHGVNMIDKEPKIGAHNSIIAFVHPKSTGGILVELKQR